MSVASLDPAVTVIDDSSPGPFEGPEKLLEIWFAPSEEDVVRRQLPLKGGRKGKDRWTGLRQVEKQVWDSMLDEVCCKVLSVIEGDEMDAYLLSESSMFVWPHKLILKTCGTTTLLLGLPTLLRIASETCGFSGVWRCFYSRKTFMFPDRQRGPHKDWSQEMAFLDKLFENSSAYTVGRMNGDHWLLYLTPPRDDVLLPRALSSSLAMEPAKPETPLAALSASLDTTPSALPVPRAAAPAPAPSPVSVPSRPDQTLEIMMTQLSPRACQRFYHPSASSDASSSTDTTSTGVSAPAASPALAAQYTSPLPPTHPMVTGAPETGEGAAHVLGAALSSSLGLTRILGPEATLDSFLFAPCGFSQNAVRGDRYATVHVTPEEAYSYASFECNFDFEGLGAEEGLEAEDEVALAMEGVGAPSSCAPGAKTGESLPQLVDDVLAIFEPSKISLTLFVSDDDSLVAGEASAGQKARAHEGMRQLLSPRLLERFEVVDRIIYEFDSYSLCFVQVVERRR
ncbi:hypothetical protein JCM10207_006825 [Rhodosporidiobolus poonsookiae]